MAVAPSRGEVWLAQLDPTRGREQQGTRPVLVVSDDAFNHGPSELVIVLPLTRTDRGLPIHVEVMPPDGGVRSRSFIMCEAIRSISRGRLIDLWGRLSTARMSDVEDKLAILLGLHP